MTNTPTIVVAACLAAGTAAAAAADTLYRVRTSIDSATVLGRTDEAQVSESKIWIGKDRFRKETPPLVFVVRFDRKLLYFIDTDRQTYSEVQLPYNVRDHLPAELAEQYRLAEQLLALEMTTTDTGESRKIGNWTARHCITTLVTQGALAQKIHVWAAPELDARLYVRAMEALLGISPVRLPVEKLEGACGGFPVLRESEGEMFGARVGMREELLSAEEREAPAGLYDPPPGFRKKDLDPAEAVRTPWDDRHSVPGLEPGEGR